MAPKVGSVFLGKYETMRLIGKGGMGEVYLARNLQNDEPVVVKVMHDYIAKDAKFRERFQSETILMAGFQHSNAVQFLDASSDDPQGPCIVMEFIPGITLDKLLARNGRFSPMRLRRIFSQLCDVLQAAHDQGIVHRDLKPANLMVLDPDTPFEKLKVMDFGLAQMADPQQKRSDAPTEYAVGTPGFMPPEQVRGEPMDHRGDLYSVGVIMYHMLTGKLPFAGESMMEILMAQATDGPPPMASLNLPTKVPSAVEAVVCECLALEPSDRPQSAKELGEYYEAALTHVYSSDAPPRVEQPATKVEAAVPDAVVEHLEAYMPEAIALYKLRGFAEELGGEMVDSKPGLIKVRLKAPKGSGGMFSWLGLGKPTGAIDMELHMKNKDPNQKNLLHVTVMLRPTRGGKLPNDPAWHAHCKKIHSTLKAYLMSKG
ncbi:MAG: serine/threonine protein kinase [Gemmataceae bacterium]|nr:serine/threonine protein kinase [Gemmataceae bacterium]